MRQFKGISFELTRRCNMNCTFCARGKAQNLDMSKEIIDKTLNEIQPYYIDCIRLNGGEPFLCPDMIEYLLSEIERKHILVRDLSIFTNGTILSPVIRDAVERFSFYLERIIPELRDSLGDDNMKDWDDPKRRVYKSTIGYNSTIIISTRKHDNAQHLENAVKFYSAIKADNFAIIRQSDDFDDDSDTASITIEGNAEENYEMLLHEPIKQKTVRRNINKYNLIAPEKDDIVNKTISISANGNVFPGCLKPYVKVDAEPMFNITECNGNFYEKVYEWGWEHPLLGKQNEQREMLRAYQWCIDKGYQLEYSLSEFMRSLETMDAFTDEYEKIALEAHKKNSYLSLGEISDLSMIHLFMKLENENCPEAPKQFYLDNYTRWPDEAKKELIQADFSKLLAMGMHYTNMNVDRMLAEKRKSRQ